MSKSIDKLSLNELLELKEASDMIGEKYASELITYQWTPDIDFNQLPNDAKIKYQKRMQLKNFSDKLSNQIEQIISEYYA